MGVKTKKKIVKSNVIDSEEIFQQIFNDNFTTLINYFYYKYGDYEKAKDFMQESFIKLWNNREKVPVNKAKGYLYTLANNAFLNELKRNKVRLEYNKKNKGNLLQIETPEFLMEEKEFLQKINRVISSLPDKHREVFLLNRIDGKTYKEIAGIFNISVKTIEKWMHVTLKVIRKEIGNV